MWNHVKSPFVLQGFFISRGKDNKRFNDVQEQKKAKLGN